MIDDEDYRSLDNQMCRAEMDLDKLEKENAELKAQLAAFHAAMEREKKPDWEKWLKDLSDGLDEYGNRASGLWANHQELLTTAARQLRYMADSFTLKANFVPSELRIKELEKLLAQIQSEYKILREATEGAGWRSPDEANQLHDKLSWLISHSMNRSLPEPPEKP